MAIKIAINGFGRIGRNVLRALEENRQRYGEELQIVAINDLSPAQTNAHLLRYDSVHGPFSGNVQVEGDELIVNGKRIKIFAQRDPKQLPWGDLDIDLVFECTGIFASKQKASVHLEAGAKKVLISAPAGNDVKTIVYGVNHHTLNADDRIVSNASCTTNCLAPLVQPLHKEIGLVTGLMTTIHSYTNDQVLTDVAHGDDLRRARSATQSQIPTKTGAAAAVGLVLPELNGRLDGFAIRVPTINVSLVDLTFQSARPTTHEEIDNILKEASNGELKGILAYNEAPLVSIDFNHNPASSIYDSTQTKVLGNLVKVLSWYDNEWGFSNRMLDTARALMRA